MAGGSTNDPSNTKKRSRDDMMLGQNIMHDFTNMSM